MAEEDVVLELRTVIEDYMVAVELGQHSKVSSLGSKICVQLVELSDSELEGQDEQVGNADLGDKRGSSQFRIISNLCQKLRKRSELALAYGNVVEFVRIRDLVCLSKLVGTIPDKNDSNNEGLLIDFDGFARILRQSIHLLKFINLRGSSGGVRNEIWLDKKSLTRSIGVGFPTYAINIDKNSLRVTVNQQQANNRVFSDQLRILANSTAAVDESHQGGLLSKILKANWFTEFVDKTLDKVYPFDRFTILVAIWIIGVECRHKALEQLIDELVDQIFHQETNSSNEEELFQLTQVGSFWLSYHKRHQASFKQTDPQRAEVEEQLSENESPESFSSSSSASLFGTMTDRAKENNNTRDMDELSTIAGHRGLPASPGRHATTTDLRAKLKTLIDEELLHGVECVVCGYQPIQLLEPLNVNSCPTCNNLLPVQRCSISYRPLELFTLDSLLSFRPKVSRLALVSPNEWARQMLALRMLSKGKSRGERGEEDEENNNQVRERVDITENFERLTVIRHSHDWSSNRRRQTGSDSSADDEELSPSDDSGASPVDRSSDTNHNHHQYASNGGDDTNYRLTLETLMKTRRVGRIASKQQVAHLEQVSESLRMIKFIEPDWSSTLPLCSADLLIVDSLGGSIKVRLVASNNLFASGSLWSCSARSDVSQLMFGCGRVFTSLELVRLDDSSAGDSATRESTINNEFMCPYCECRLNEVQSLYGCKRLEDI